MFDPILLATAGDVAAGTFGGVAALLLVGGGVMLRSQKERHRYQLARAAIERGQPVPSTADLPAWLASLRQAVVILAVGVGIAAAGGLARGAARSVPMPTAADLAADVPPPPPAPGLPAFARPVPPRPNLAVERWHLAQDEQAVGLAAVGSGGVLVLLGLVRVAFAVAERRYEPATALVPSPSPAAAL